MFARHIPIISLRKFLICYGHVIILSLNCKFNLAEIILPIEYCLFKTTVPVLAAYLTITEISNLLMSSDHNLIFEVT